MKLTIKWMLSRIYTQATWNKQLGLIFVVADRSFFLSKNRFPRHPNRIRLRHQQIFVCNNVLKSRRSRNLAVKCAGLFGMLNFPLCSVWEVIIHSQIDTKGNTGESSHASTSGCGSSQIQISRHTLILTSEREAVV